MPVLDYPRYMVTADGHPRKGILTVPAFHTGPVGFIPGNRVYAHLSRKPRFAASTSSARPRSVDDQRCEVLFTPFVHNLGEMFHLRVMLIDQPGVVRRLLDALLDLEININKQESCALYAGLKGMLHYVDLIVGWSRSDDLFEPLTARPSDRWAYRHLAHRMPIEDGRYLRLYEQIMLKCSDIIVFDRSEGRSLPDIRMTPFSFRSAGESNEEREVSPLGEPRWPTTKLIQRADEEHARERFRRTSSVHGTSSWRGAPPYNVTVHLTSSEVDSIVRRTGGDHGEPVRYLLSSDAETRTLRALFVAQSKNLVHVGFQHRDEPGSLEHLGWLLEKADYNILQSLARIMSREDSTWEVLLESTATGAERSTGAESPVPIDERKDLEDALAAVRDLLPWPPPTPDDPAPADGDPPDGGTGVGPAAARRRSELEKAEKEHAESRGESPRWKAFARRWKEGTPLDATDLSVLEELLESLARDAVPVCWAEPLELTLAASATERGDVRRLEPWAEAAIARLVELVGEPDDGSSSSTEDGPDDGPDDDPDGGDPPDAHTARSAIWTARAAVDGVRLDRLHSRLKTTVGSFERARIERMRIFGFKIGHPSYPRRPKRKVDDLWLPTPELVPAQPEDETVTRAARSIDDATVAVRYRRVASRDDLDRLRSSAARWRVADDSDRALALDFTADRLAQNRPQLFLSYPGRASTLATRFIAAIEEKTVFEVTHYQQPDNNVVINQAIGLIRRCDLFVGLWYHEEAVDDGSLVSQWMPFEYGVARGLAKPSLVFQSNRLPLEVRRRLDSGVATKVFDPETFVADEMHDFVTDIAGEWDRYLAARS